MILLTPNKAKNHILPFLLFILPRATEQYFQSQEYTPFTTKATLFHKKYAPFKKSPQKHEKTEEKPPLPIINSVMRGPHRELRIEILDSEFPRFCFYQIISDNLAQM